MPVNSPVFEIIRLDIFRIGKFAENDFTVALHNFLLVDVVLPEKAERICHVEAVWRVDLVLQQKLN